MGGTATFSNGGAWTNASSRKFKEGFRRIDAADVLTRVLALDISRWQYIGSGEGQHVGPVAEDFHAAFGLGRSEKQIATVDADGVALAAIQGLNAKLEAENAALREQLAVVREQQSAEMAALRALVESRLRGGALRHAQDHAHRLCSVSRCCCRALYGARGRRRRFALRGAGRTAARRRAAPTVASACPAEARVTRDRRRRRTAASRSSPRMRAAIRWT